MSTSIEEKKSRCSTHCENSPQFFCSDCTKSACKDCEFILKCLEEKHNVRPMSIASNEAEQDAMKLIKTVEEIKTKLEESYDSIVKNQAKYENHLKLCRCAIKMKENEKIEKVKKEGRKLMSHLEELYKKRQEATEKELKDLDSKKTQINGLNDKITSILKQPEEKENLVELQTKIADAKDKVLETDIDKFSLQNEHIILSFIPSADLICTKEIGKVVTVDERFNVAKNDRSFTVTKGQQFVVEVSSAIKDKECKLAATLTSSSGEESRPHVKYQGNGEYRITSTCNIEGDWNMKITIADEHVLGSPVNVKGSPVNVKGSPVNVKGSPVNVKGSPIKVKVEKLGLVRTIGKVLEYTERRVSDIMLNTDGCMLVLSFSREILRFNQSGSFINKLLMPQGTRASRMHRMSDGNIVYSDSRNCAIMCDEKRNTIRSFGKNTLNSPGGLDVDEKNRVLYVADENKYCVFKFNIDDGSMLGKIGIKGTKLGEMIYPCDIALTKEGNIVVADFGNNRIQLFNANGEEAKVIIGHGEEDGKVVSPTCVIVDADDNLIISSKHKLQLFDKNGVFKRRIDHEDDGLVFSVGSSINSYRPRAVAVANNALNKNACIQIYNY